MATAPQSHGKTPAKKSAAKAPAKKTASKASGARTSPQDAIALLKADHREVEKLFGQFEKASDDDRKQQIAQQICDALKVHTQVEEEIFYPATREVLKDDDIVDEAIVEHASAKDLIAQIEGMSPGEELYDAKVKVLQEMIEHHVEEEEKEYFPQVQKTDLDLKAMGEQMAERKQELEDELDGAAATQ